MILYVLGNFPDVAVPVDSNDRPMGIEVSAPGVRIVAGLIIPFPGFVCANRELNRRFVGFVKGSVVVADEGFDVRDKRGQVFEYW